MAAARSVQFGDPAGRAVIVASAGRVGPRRMRRQDGSLGDQSGPDRPLPRVGGLPVWGCWLNCSDRPGSEIVLGTQQPWRRYKRISATAVGPPAATIFISGPTGQLRQLVRTDRVPRRAGQLVPLTHR